MNTEKIGKILIALGLALLISAVVNHVNAKQQQVQVSGKNKHFIMHDDSDWYNQQLAAFIK